MDFSFGAKPQQPSTSSNPQFGASSSAGSKHSNKRPNKILIWATKLLFLVVIVLVIALLVAIGTSQPKSQESYIYTNKLQAVFLNTGQVYFGNVKSINPQYLVLTNIFYLQTSGGTTSGSSSSSTTPTKVSLVKLGCELHAPYDQMVINMSQVTFWENLQSDGQVAKAVSQYEKTYPHGQVCADQSTSSGSTTSNVQNAPTNTPTASSSSTSKP